MQEISLNILDIVQNSIKAQGNLIKISIDINREEDLLSVIIEDNGYGMSTEKLKKIKDPFYTTRTTRSIGLGIPFFRQAALITGGSFYINSKLKKGTIVSAKFVFSHIDRMPLGDIVSTIHLLITMNPDIHFIYTYKLEDKKFILDTRQLKDILGDVRFDVPEVSNFIRDYLHEHHNNINNNEYI